MYTALLKKSPEIWALPIGIIYISLFPLGFFINVKHNVNILNIILSEELANMYIKSLLCLVYNTSHFVPKKLPRLIPTRA